MDFLKTVRNPGRLLDHLRFRWEYLKLRLKSGTGWNLDLYAELQDKKVELGEAYTGDKSTALCQLDFLQNQGLDPSDTFLDIGCGELRAGKYFIDYLNTGNYYGMDISAAALDRGREVLHEQSLTDKNPTLVNNSDLAFEEFDDGQFDIIWASSVLTHLPKQEIDFCFAHVGRALADDGVFYPTFHEADEYVEEGTHSIHRSARYAHPRSYFENLADEYGYDLQVLPYDEHPTQDEMHVLELTKK